MTKRQQVDKDTKIVHGALKKYGGEDGFHFGFFGFNSGERQFLVGGAADKNGICIAEGIATMINITPGLDEKYIDLVAETAKEVLKHLKSLPQQ